MTLSPQSFCADDVIITDELEHRPSRAPDYQAESRALRDLAQAMATKPDDVLQRLVEAAMTLTRADSVGVSLLGPGGQHGIFHWVAATGAWAPYLNGQMPREASPCGVVIARDTVLLMKQPGRAFPALLQAEPAIHEGLLVPFHVDGQPIGTVWAIKHGLDGHFEREDARLLRSLSGFAAAGHQIQTAVDAAQASGRESEAKYRVLFDSIDERFCIIEIMFGVDGQPDYYCFLEVNTAFERQTGLTGVVGKSMRTLRPGHEEHWFERYSRIAMTGTPERFEERAEALGRWYDVYAFRVGPPELRQVGILFRDINERKQVEAALRESEAKYRVLFDSIDEGYCIIEVIFDADGKPVDLLHVEANQAYERYTGLRGIVGKRAREIVPEGGPWLDFYGNVALTGQSARLETYLAPGVSRWISSYASRIGGEGSSRLAVVFNDVTDRKRAEQELLRSNELLRTTFDSSLQILQLFKAVRNEHSSIIDFEWLLTNKQWDDRWGPRDGKSLLKENPAVVESGVWNKFLDVMKTGDPITHEHFYAHEQFDGWFLQTIAKANDGILLSTLDITDQKRAEIAVRESEERFVQFANASAAGLWMRDTATLAMEYVSPAVGMIYGVEPEGVLGPVERWAALIIPEDREKALKHLEAARRGDTVVHEFRIKRPSDGAFRWIRNTDFPLHDNGNIPRIGGIAEDVTEAKLAREHQEVLLAELQHRVRNIMAIMRSIVSRTGERAGTVQDYLTLTMGRLLAFARVQALLTRAANISVGIRSIVEDEISVQAQHAGQYVIDGPDIKLSPKAAEVLTLAIHELATNALKYGALSLPIGSVTVTWSTFEKRGGQWLGLDWTERGAPARPAVSTDAPQRRGFGSELIEGRIPYELKGRGTFAIEPGGAHCHLEFPLMESASVLETSAPVRASVFGGALDMTGEADLTGHCVLVVEDDFYLATDAMRALQGAGAEVMGPCATDEDARAELKECRPDAVVLDINLGKGPSFKLAEHLKDNGIPFVFTTGYDQEVIPTEFKDVERLEKPLQLRQIVGAIAMLLAKTA
ncbi:PAS domain S-box protein [Methylobacterium durans]|uniref:PAS domain S-box protein n=1 Tax=Methylobacterium durans TaxID=2202825 RepID=UPI002B002E17|nr:PAS domain S-box protein [Methylobacterium durans]MEA1835268.1 PAS domain S-box protein [Methylobacterium durans]